MMDDISKRCPCLYHLNLSGLAANRQYFLKLLYQIIFTRPNSHKSPGTAALVSLGCLCSVSQVLDALTCRFNIIHSSFLFDL